MDLISVQLDIAWGDKQTNLEKVGRLLEEGKIETGSLIVLPEMFATGFTMEAAKICEGDNGETVQALCDWAVRYRSTVVGGVAMVQDGRPVNRAVVAGPDGKVVAQYEKIHPFSYSGEDDVYSKGERVVTFEWNGFRAAPFVCYDLRFPEVFRQAMLRGANLFAVIANWPRARELHWVTLLQARAIENQAYVVGANRVGRSPKLNYSGRSMVIGPRGEVVADGGNVEGLVRGKPDLGYLTSYRRDFPALNDVRREFLGDFREG